MSNDSAADLGSALGVLNSHVTVVKSGGKKRHDPLAKRENELLRSNALTVDDGQSNVFDALGRGKLVEPTYDPMLLSLLMQQNNTLMQCSAAMEVNIDGTGYAIERLDGEANGDADKTAIENIKNFFDEVYPGESIITQRRALRRDLEATGNGYIEVLRNAAKEIVFLRRLDAKLMRLVSLDDPIMVEKTVKRMGKETTVKMMVRERRYCMQVGSKLRFFKEFGCSRDIDMLSGAWVGQANTSVIDDTPQSKAFGPGTNPLKTSSNVLDTTNSNQPTTTPGAAPARVLGTEVICMTVLPDVATGYGVPRWINQVPSVLGSRKAEEFNLEFFNAGGLPPAMILVQGGQLSASSRTALTAYLSGKSKFKQRGVIAEIYPASGDIGSAGSVKVTVERFGDERQKDSMFSGYDERCAEHVRQAFRLPPLFVGRSQDQNFATAYASYMVAEAQVFRPEREEFDEIINVKIMRAIAPEYIFRSLPLTITDVENQLKALEMVKDIADPEEFLSTVNEIASVTLTPRDNLEEEQALDVVNQVLGRDAMGNKLDRRDAAGNKAEGDEGDVKQPQRVTAGKKGLIAKMDDGIMTELAEDWAAHMSGKREFSAASVSTMNLLIKSLEPQVRSLFNSYVSMKLTDARHDMGGTAALIAHAGECLHRDAE